MLSVFFLSSFILLMMLIDMLDFSFFDPSTYPSLIDLYMRREHVRSWVSDGWLIMGRFLICVSNVTRKHKSMDLNQLVLITQLRQNHD